MEVNLKIPLDSSYRYRVIPQEVTTPYIPHQRGKVEQHIGTIKDTLRALSNAGNVAPYFGTKLPFTVLKSRICYLEIKKESASTI